MEICGFCNKRYSDAPGQMMRYGLRFRFVERCEVPRSGFVESIDLGTQKKVFKFLLLFKERQEKLGQEVMWMPEEMTQKVLKLPKRVAAAMKNTYAIRGDDATDSDDVALQKIKDLIEEIDPNIFRDLLRRNRKRLS